MQLFEKYNEGKKIVKATQGEIMVQWVSVIQDVYH